MKKIHGITITLYEEKVVGSDPFGGDIVEATPIDVDNVLVVPALSEEVINNLNITGKKAVYTLGIPRDDEHNWENKRVDFFGQSFKTFGAVTQGIDDMMPLDWNKKVQCEKYE